MPEYLAPGVYVEETSFRSKSIEGVSTTTTGFIGPARYGPINLEPDVLTSLVEFEYMFGDRQRLEFDNGGTVIDNYLWHAARAFFEEGGKRLYVSRVFKRLEKDGRVNDGRSRGTLGAGDLEIRGRFPGAAGNRLVEFTINVGQNILVNDGARLHLRGVTPNDIVWLSGVPPTSPPSPPATAPDGFYIAVRDIQEETWRFGRSKTEREPADVWLKRPTLTSSPPSGLVLGPSSQVRIVTVTVTVYPSDDSGSTQVWADLPPDPDHQRAGFNDSLTARFGETPSRLSEARTLPIIIRTRPDGGIRDGRGLVERLRTELLEQTARREGVTLSPPTPRPPSSPPLPEPVALRLHRNFIDPTLSSADRTLRALLTDGNDGQRPTASEYEGKADPTTREKTGLKTFEDIEDISIVAAPGSTYGYGAGYENEANTIIGLLISHATRMRYRIAVLDSGDAQDIASVRAMRARFDSTYAAFYYPWIRILDPVTGRENVMPPSGFVAGIYARNDINRAVYKAPANEVVNLAIGFEQLLNKSQQDVLNPEGINCFRFFEGRGFRLWGARTISSDPEWKYVNLRRYFAYLERSIDRGTQWAVFEPNGEALWSNVRRTIDSFLLNEWQMGALLGERDKAYFVKCDRSTMTQNDLDNGRLVCLIGVAALRPAEYVIFRIGQWTADRKV
jgi:phage tail sheath protein FI